MLLAISGLFSSPGLVSSEGANSVHDYVVSTLGLSYLTAFLLLANKISFHKEEHFLLINYTYLVFHI